MGNQFSTTTLVTTKDSHGHAYWVGINSKPFFKGSRKNCYYGYLNGYGPRAGEKVVVKRFSDGSGTKKKWETEMLKVKWAHHFAEAFAEHANCPRIKVNQPQVVLMDTVSKMNQIYEGRGRSGSLNEDDWVSIEENIKADDFQTFCGVDRKSHSSSVMGAFTHFTYHQSGGRAIVSDIQGVVKDGGDSFHVTDPVIHSLQGSFGKDDGGVVRINEFFKMHRCSSICRDMPKMLPLTPPPSFEDITSVPMMFAHRPIVPSAPLYENVFIP
ncbi:alpha-protein kinase vwkA-like isoform X2 [Gigantopelta aegis]|nr:alpha-protein kinase vwkA-like isoform X2 [Gigantopelta aegis]